MECFRFLVVNSMLAFILLLSGCRSDKSIDGFDLVSNPSGIGSVDSKIILTSIQATFDDTVSSTGASQFLEIGQSGNVKTFSLLKFDTISDTATILNAKLILNTNTLFTDGSNKSTFTASVHQISENWQDATVNYETRPDFDMSALSSTTIISATASTGGTDSLFTEVISFEFETAGIELIESWKDTLNDNFGFFISHENSNFIKEFFSENSGINQPRLELEIESSTGKDTVLVVASEDAFIVEQISPLSEGPLYLDNIFTNTTVLKFDLSDISRETVVNDAVLKLDFLEDLSVIKASGFTYRIDLLTEPFTGMESVEIDSSFSPIFDIINTTVNPSTVSMNRVLQFWLTEDLENHGILIRALAPGSDISKVALHSNSTNAGLAPRIEAIISSAGLGN